MGTNEDTRMHMRSLPSALVLYPDCRKAQFVVCTYVCFRTQAINSEGMVGIRRGLHIERHIEY